MPAVCDVVIPVKDAAWWVDWCLEELFRTTAPADLGEVVVVDDTSTPDSFATLTRICSRFERVRLVRNEGRPGFGGACNFGANLGEGSHILLLNTDCFLTQGTIRKLMDACVRDRTIGMACPLSNNSPVLTYPMFPGLSYVDMNRLLETASAGRPPEEVAVDACTVVGNCLMVTRECWVALAGFDPVWGTGYGEETDLQFRGMARGFRGVACIDTYVFHFGSASFRYQEDLSALQKSNYEMFMERWGEAYRTYAERCSHRDPLRMAQDNLESFEHSVQTPDVLFLLPGISQSVGGIHAVLDLCNFLIRNGVDAKCAVIGDLDPKALRAYSEPILFALLRFADERELIEEDWMKPRCIVSTLYTTAPVAFSYSRLRGIPFTNFLQGRELYFERGSRWNEVEGTYRLADEFIATSAWLEELAHRHSPGVPVRRLPLGVNEFLFDTGAGRARSGARVRVCVVLRAAHDKGQWILLSVLDALSDHRDRICVTILAAPEYEVPRLWEGDPDTIVCRLPLDQGRIAREMRGCDILIDASFHEGYGLFPLEAMACGATVVASDSGGIGEFLEDGRNGLLIQAVNKAEPYVEAVLRLCDDRELLQRFQEEAVRTASRYDATRRNRGYLEYFRERLAAPFDPSIHGDHVLRSTALEGYPGIEFGNQAYKYGPDDLVMEAVGHDPAVLLPSFAVPSGSTVVGRFELRSSLRTVFQLYLPTLSPPSLRSLFRTRVGGYGEERSVIRTLLPGKNVLWVQLSSADLAGALRMDPGREIGSYLLSGIEFRAIPGPVQDDSSHLEAAFNASSQTLLQRGGPAGFEGITALQDVTLVRPRWTIRSTGIDPYLYLGSVSSEPDTVLGFSIRMNSPGDTVLRLYYQTVGFAGHSEAQCVAHRVRSGENRIDFFIDIPNLHGPLRLDPGEIPGDFEVQSIEIRRFPRVRLRG